MSQLYEDNPEHHLFLYAKGWYKKSGKADDLFITTYLLNDLEEIIAYITAIPKESITEDNIAYWLSECVKPIVINNPYKLNDILGKWWINRGFIDSMLDIMSVASKDEIGFDLGLPDKNILPLNDEV
jgi:hypothetical protein